jgi:hypothetical protein
MRVDSGFVLFATSIAVASACRGPSHADDTREDAGAPDRREAVDATADARARDAAASADDGGGAGSGNDGARTADGPAIEAPIAGDWWDPRWTRRRPLRLEPMASGLVDFPVPVRLEATDIDHSSTATGGADLRFVDDGGAVLPHEIEDWDPMGASLVWVRVRKIEAGAAKVVWMYYGNPAAASPAASEEVWPARYAAVWHFAGGARDATVHHFDGAEVSVRFAPGRLGRAAAFDSAMQEHITLARNTQLPAGAQGVTVSAWIKHSGRVNDGQDIVLGIGTAMTDGHLSRVSVAVSPELGFIGEANPDERAWDVTTSPANTCPNGEWHYMGVVFDLPAKTISLYKDGAPLGHPWKGSWTAAAYDSTPANRVTIGCEEDESKSFFNGMIDELRVETTARPASWMAAQARAVAGTLLTVGKEETISR